MKSVEIKKNNILISFSDIEVAFLSNAISQALYLVDPIDFQTLTACSPAEAEKIRTQLHDILEEYDKKTK